MTSTTLVSSANSARTSSWKRISFDKHSIRGFSVIELMVALLLIAISATLALPSYRDMIEKRQLTQGAEQLLAFVNSAQLESVRYNSRLNVSYSRTGDVEWCVGANLGNTICDCTVTDTSNAQYCAINGRQWIFDDSLAGDLVLLKSISGDSGGDNAYSFEPARGLLINLDDSLAMEMHSKSSNYQMELRVSRTGQALVCSKDASHDVTGYAVCPAVPVSVEPEVAVVSEVSEASS